MGNNDRITSAQMVNILMLTMVGAGSLTLPRSLALVSETDQWLILLIGGGAASLFALLSGKVICLLPGKTYFEILTIALTKPIAYLIGIGYTIYLIVINGFLVRVFGEVVKDFLLFQTPLELINITILLVSCYAVRKGIEILGRVMEFLFPFIILVALILFSLVLVDSDLSNLLPFFEIGPKEILRGIPISFFSFIGFEMILFFGSYLNKPEQAVKISCISVGAVLLFYLSLIIVTFAQLGTAQVKKIIWPTLTIFKTVEFPGAFIENVEGAVMALWVLTVFSSVTPLLLGNSLMLKSLTNSRDHSYFVLPSIFFIYLISLLPENMPEAYLFLEKFSVYVASFMVLVIPTVVFLSVYIQSKLKRREKNSA